jgi:serine/threonine protein kinase
MRSDAEQFNRLLGKQLVRPATHNITIRDLKILAQIGSGSYGEVYLVQHKGSSKLYAMKALSKRKYS